MEGLREACPLVAVGANMGSERLIPAMLGPVLSAHIWYGEWRGKSVLICGEVLAEGVFHGDGEPPFLF